uniref:Vesicle-associated membrane protein 7 n=1 Tax=Ixodes ricinus TaxID=34613 RepID=A0A0K8RM59_IXORI
MPLLYCVIARGSTVLSRYASCAGNFSEVTEQILQRISPDTPKLTYSHGSYLFHYILEEGIIYLCITDDEFERAKAFHFLVDIQTRFQATYGRQAQSALAYAMNSEFSRVLANQMKHYSGDRGGDNFAKVQGEIDELKGIMVKNIDTVTSRGERLELLVNKTEVLSNTSVTFRKASRNLARSMLIKNIKIALIIALVVLLLIYIIVSSACGGLSWPNCV